MNVKYNADELHCLLGEDYDRVYSTLKRSLGPDAGLFAERLIGHGYLQWRLPGEGWQTMAQCEPALRPEVSRKVAELKDRIGQRFGANRAMAANILSTPDESFVYFRKDAYGKIAVCFTAWGYMYPERVDTSDLRMAATPKGATEKVTITILRDGQPVGNYPFELNGYQRKTAPNGSFPVGHVEIGQKFSLAVDGVMNEYTVSRGYGDIKIYLASARPAEEPVDSPAPPVEETAPQELPEIPPVDNNNIDLGEKELPKDELPKDELPKDELPKDELPKEEPHPYPTENKSEKEGTVEVEPPTKGTDAPANKEGEEKKSQDKKEEDKKDSKKENSLGLPGLLSLLSILAMIVLAYIAGLKLI